MILDVVRKNTQELEKLGAMGIELKDIVPLLKNNFEIAEQKNKVLLSERMLNLAYYAGKQLYEWNASMGLVRPPTLMADEVVPIQDNVIGTLLDTRVGLMSNNPPHMEVVATNDGLMDFARARLANQAAEMQWNRLNLSEFFANSHKSAGIFYNTFCHLDWDYASGRIGDTVQSDGTTRLMPEGDMMVELVSPLDVFVDPMADRVMPERIFRTDARWLFRNRVIDMSDLVNSNWNREPGQATTIAGARVLWGGIPTDESIVPHDTTVASQDEIAMHGQLGADVTRDAEGASIYQKPGSKDKKGKLVLVTYYYELPSMMYPRGRFAAFLPKNSWWVLGYREELPHATPQHKSGLFGWCMVNDVRLPGRLAGKCRMTDSRPLQEELNRTLTSWRALRDRILPYLLVDKDFGVDPRKIRAQGLVAMIEYVSSLAKTGNKPELVVPAGLIQEAQLAMAEIDKLTGRMEDRMQVHSAAYYPRNSATTQGEIFAYLKQDMDRLENNDVRQAEENVYAPFVKLILRMMQRYYTEERMMACFSSTGKPVVRKFSGKDIHFEDVWILPGSTMKRSKLIAKENAMTIYQAGGYQSTNPLEALELRRDFFEVMEMKISSTASAWQLDRDNARDEFYRMCDGEECSVDHYDDDLIHVPEHFRDMKSKDFRNLPDSQRDGVRQLMNDHLVLHQARLVQQALQSPEAIMVMAMLSGAEVGGTVQNPGNTVPTADGQQMVKQENAGAAKTGNLGGGSPADISLADTAGLLDAGAIPAPETV